MIQRLTFWILFFILFQFSNAQKASIYGKITTPEGEPLAFATVEIVHDNHTHEGTIADENGAYSLSVNESGTFTLSFRSLGFKSIDKTLNIKLNERKDLNVSLSPDLLNIDQVVVTGTRRMVSSQKTPIIVNTLDKKLFESTQSVSLSEGLNFVPGLRVENNCQNCGFTQLRMNGLEGAYSQILINSRPVFSALVGVYGLDMIPANMIDRVEVIKGGGSALYGGNAIAGTVNVITKDPNTNSFEVGINQAFIDGDIPDRTISFNGTIVDKELTKGISLYGFNRMRNFYDANNDGFSEITMLRNTTLGFNTFWKPNERSRLALNFNTINEFRRGGNKFELSPHQTDVTEQLRHRVLGGDISYEQRSKNEKHSFSVYTSAQFTDRESYYGGGGRVLSETDSLTADDILAINAYGASEDASIASGVQYNFDLNNSFNVTAGVEHQFNNVSDQMPGYGRVIDQKVHNLGNYLQLNYSPIRKLTFLLGGRLDYVNINGLYNLDVETFENREDFLIAVPRLAIKYDILSSLKLRASYAQGYRTPQAFDEDLHIETVGGAARFVRINPDLKIERSNAFNLSLNYDKSIKNWQLNLVADAFFTKLNNPFIFSDPQELPNGIGIIEKRNGDGANIYGLNLEANVAFKSKLLIQSALTIQQAKYVSEEVIWSPAQGDANPETSTINILRTPNLYGYFNLTYTPIKPLSLSLSNVFTGKMDVAHLINPDTEYTVIKRTPIFSELNLKAAYTHKFDKKFNVEVFGGIQNILNSYQNDFDRCADRDAGYVYGPLRPRTYFMGLKLGLN